MVINLGKTVRHLRKALRMTQRAMAENLGITPVHLCNIEKGKSQPSSELLNRFHKLWDVDLYVLGWCLYGDTANLPPALRDAASILAERWQAELSEKLEKLHAMSE